MNKLKKEEKDKLKSKEPLLVLLLMKLRRKDKKNQNLERLQFNKQNVKSKKENKK